MPPVLLPGGAVRVSRLEGDVVVQVTAPAAGSFVVSGLLPGSYVARDEVGGEVGFEVVDQGELTVIEEFGGEAVEVAVGEPLPAGYELNAELVPDESAQIQQETVPVDLNAEPVPSAPVEGVTEGSVPPPGPEEFGVGGSANQPPAPPVEEAALSPEGAAEEGHLEGAGSPPVEPASPESAPDAPVDQRQGGVAPGSGAASAPEQGQGW